MDQILQAVGSLVVKGVGYSAIAYAFFHFLGKKWLDAKFAERLESYKHKQQKELEELRFKISSLFDRTTKLHQREFEVLPEAWGRLNDAYWNVRSFVSPLQTVPDLNRMSDKHLAEFLEKIPLGEWQKEELREEREKTSYYQKAIFWYHLNEANKLFRESRVYLLKHGIFLPVDIRQKFNVIEELIWDALVEREHSERYAGARETTDTKEQALRKNGEALLKDLEAEVRSRLWSSKDAAL